MGRLFTIILISIYTSFALAQVAPTATIVNTNTLFCTDKPIVFQAVSDISNLSYRWAVLPSKGLSSNTDLKSPTVTLTFSGTANYTVFLTATDIAGASSTYTTLVGPKRSARAEFNASLSSEGFPSKLTLTNYSMYNIKNYWKFSDAATLDTSFSLVKNYSKNGNYSVLLYAYGEKGCDDSKRYDFTIAQSSSIVLPNVFTPNYDGNNDVFIPITKGISGLKGWIYNRYGAIVTTWDTPKGGWDGHTTSGEESPDGVYFVFIDAWGFDGQIYKLKGTVTLLR
jgi:gliding motility-associated-like protein